jgi:protein phosphatase
MQLRFGSHAVTDVGLVRRRNEDAFLDRPERGLWVVADGMGGHQRGDFASRLIVETLDSIAPTRELPAFVDAVRDALTTVDRELGRRAEELGPDTLIGSTVVVLLAVEDTFACVWAGDSRLYRRRDGTLQQLTTDHSRVQELIDQGLLRPEEAEHHPASNIVTRAVGAGALECGVITGEMRAGDRFLLCSDGLHGLVRPVAINEALKRPGRKAAAQLLKAVMARGARDNVTIVIVEVS